MMLPDDVEVILRLDRNAKIERDRRRRPEAAWRLAVKLVAFGKLSPVQPSKEQHAILAWMQEAPGSMTTEIWLLWS
jgi:hypothetical protein